MEERKLRDSHTIEQLMGMRFYSTHSPGIEGKLRLSPKDFQVEEILPDNRVIKINDVDFTLGEDEAGLFTEFILIKEDVESHSAQHRIASALGRDINDINVAGTKDKSAHTAQRATIWRVPPEELSNLQLNRITIRSPRTTIYKTYLGDLNGNFFTIKISDISGDVELLRNQIKEIMQEVKQFSGIPNFFGHQRFGSRSPTSHEIGKQLLLGNIEEAINYYIGKTSIGEAETTSFAKRVFLKTNDSEETLNLLPKSMVFERMILKHLIKSPNNFIGALQKLPKNLLRIFIHSYQSYLWNLALSERMKRYGNLSQKPIDIIENKQVVLPIVGYMSNLSDNDLSNFILDILEKDGITLENFKVKCLPSLKFGGSNRKLAMEPKKFDFTISANPNGNIDVNVRFSLKPGSYATVLMRELMKTTPLNY
ncbi:MAG: tRNA pseudouridine(13) synthase TruD [Candidatus Heimdallarchaeota archaeon]